MKDSPPDLIRWVIDRMMLHDERITRETAIAVEREARAHWGGTTVGYVAKSCASDRAHSSGGRARHDRPDAPADARAVLRDYLAMPVEQAAKRHGISRATLYRLIKRA